MMTILPAHEADPNASDADAADDADFKPLTAQQAQQWRLANPALSVWRVLLVQLVAGVLVTLLAWLVTGQVQVLWSTAYGALAVLLPAAVFARGMVRQRHTASAGSALVGLMVWELAKLGLTLAMLLAAPRLVFQLNWLALLAGFVVTMKVYWLVLLRARRPSSVKIN